MLINPSTHDLELGKGAVGYVRSGGLHMSDIYNDLYKKLYPKRFDKRDSDGVPLPMPMDKVEAGLVFEELLEEGLKRRLSGDGRPGELVTKHAPGCIFTDALRLTPCKCGAGIAYSPDLLLFNGHSRLGEIKLSWYSTKYTPVTEAQAVAAGRPDLYVGTANFERSRFDKWMTQIMAYLYHLHMTEAKLIVFFVNGNYKPPSPVVLAWDLQFTQRELNENWAALKNHAIAENML